VNCLWHNIYSGFLTRLKIGPFNRVKLGRLRHTHFIPDLGRAAGDALKMPMDGFGSCGHVYLFDLFYCFIIIIYSLNVIGNTILALFMCVLSYIWPFQTWDWLQHDLNSDPHLPLSDLPLNPVKLNGKWYVREILMCSIHTTGLRAFGQMYMRVGGTSVETRVREQSTSHKLDQSISSRF
jgi:hypothetical protein